MINLTKEQILQCINILGIKGRKNSNSFIMCCPYHNDDTPSFSIKLDSFYCKCFGCSKTVSFNKMCKDIYGKSAYELLGLKNDKLVNYFFKQSFIKPEKKQEEIRYITNIKGKLLDVFSNDNIYTHLKEYRRLTDNFIKEFGITYTNFCEINRDEKAIEQDDIKGTKFFHRIMIPVYYQNKLVNYEGRDYTLNQKPKVLYPKNTTKPLFNFDNLDFNKPLYLTEGFMDFAILYQHVSKNSSCIMGNQLNELQIKLVNKFKQIILVPDNDDGGKVLINQMDEYYTEGDLYIVDLPYGIKDIGECEIKNLKECISNKKVYMKKLIDDAGLFK